MKFFFLFLLAPAFAIAQGHLVKETSLERAGGGQFEAQFSHTSGRLMMKLKSCYFRTVPTEGIELSEDLSSQAKALFNGKALILSNQSPYTKLPLPTGSWLSLSYTMDMNQFQRTTNPRIPAKLETFQVKSPMIIINSKLSTILAVLEKRVHEECLKIRGENL